MKKSTSTLMSAGNQKLSFRPETIRVLTERELTLVAAGNCLKASAHSQETSSEQLGIC
jgi:hypothetical protein